MTRHAGAFLTFVTSLPQLAGALCKGEDPQLWDNHVHGETMAQRRTRHVEARAVCRECPVRGTCLQVHRQLTADRLSATGVWGGSLFTSPRARADEESETEPALASAVTKGSR